MINVAVIDDHEAIRLGVAAALAGHSAGRIAVVSEDATVDAFLARDLRAGSGQRLPIATLQDPRPEKWGRRLATMLVPATSNLDRSDHVPFWKRGIPAIMLCDTAHLRNANYHQPSDTADTLDYDRIAALTDAIAHLVERTLAARDVPASGAPT